MKNDKQKKKSTNKSKKQSKYRALSLVLTSSLVIAPLTVPLTFYLSGGITASAAVLDAEILSNISSSNDSGTTTANRFSADGATKNVNFSISGSELVGGSVITSGTKQAVLTIPNELNGRVSTNGVAEIDTNITLTVDDLTFLTGTLDAVNQLSNLLTNIVDGALGSLIGVTLDLTTVNQKIDALNNLENFGSAEFNSTAVLSSDGKYIHANIDDGLGLVLAQNVSSLLEDLKEAVNALNATGSGVASDIVAAAINATLLPVKGTVNTAIDLALPFVELGGAGVNQLADASVLGATTINIPTTVVSPTSLTQNLDARFVGTVVKSDVIDVSLINTANGVSDIYYAGNVAVVAPPIVTNTTGTSATGYTVTGTATAGNTVTIKNAGGTTIASGPATGGNFSINIPQGEATENEPLTATASDGSNDSTPTAFTTPADAVIIPSPVVTSVTGDSAAGYTVTGTATAGNTVTIKNAGGTTIASGPATGGNFSINIPQGEATENEPLTATASDGSNDSTPTAFTTPADAVIIPSPVVTSVTGDSATGYMVTGIASPGDIVSVKNSGGTVIGTGVANGDGDFTVILLPGVATPNEPLTATASDNSGNQSEPTAFTTPADSVVVPAPTVTNVTGNSLTGYTVNGTATPGDNVVIKNASGTIISSGLTNSQGNFTAIIPLGLATPSEDLTAVAVNGLNQSSATSFTTPADAVIIPAPIITGVTGNSSAGYTVTGTTTPGNTVSIKNSGGTVIAAGVANPLGQFSIILPIGSATPVELLNAVASDGLGNQSTATSFLTPPDLILVAPPTVTNITGNSSSGYTVTGTATPGNFVSIKNTGGTVIAVTPTDISGNYTAVIPVGQATPNEQLKAVASDLLGNQSTATNFNTPTDQVLVASPVVTAVTGTSSTGYTVTGLATPGDSVLVKNTGGTVIGIGLADVSGNFTVTLPVGSAVPSQQLSAVADDGNGHQSLATSFTTPADPVVVTAPVVTNVTGSSSTGYTVTGTASPGDTVTIRNTGGTVIGTDAADLNGDFNVIIPVGSVAPGQQLTATAQDPDGNTSPGTSFTTPADPVVVPSPIIENVTGTSATGYTVTGTATAGDIVSIKNTGGTVIGTGTANSGGIFTVTIPTGLATPLEQLFAIADDGDGHQSTATSFTTPADPIVVTSPVVTGVTGSSNTGYTVTGTATAGDTITVKNTGGTVIGTAVVDPSGNFTVIISSGAATPNQQLTAAAQDPAGNTSPGTNFMTPADPVVVPAPNVTTVTGTSTTGYTVMGTATAGNTVLIKNTGGTVIGTATANASGGFTITIPIGAATPLEQLSAVADDGAGHQSSATPFITPANPIEVTAPIVTNVTGTSATGYTVTGTATAGDTVTIKNTGGMSIGTATVSSNGEFNVIIAQGSAIPSEQLKAIASDEAGNQSPATPFMTPADPVVIPAPVVTNVTGTSATGYIITGTAVAGDTVSIKKLNGTEIGSAQVNGNSNYTVVLPVGVATPIEQLRAIDSDGDGNQSPATSFMTPADPVFVAAPIITSVVGDSQTGYTVEGTATAGDSVSLKTLDGADLGDGEVTENGTFSIKLDSEEVNQLQQLHAIAIDNELNSSLPTLFTIPADPSSNIEAPVIENVTGTSKTGYIVTGKAEAGNKVNIRNVSGRVIGSGVADLNGDFLFRALRVLDGEFAIALPVGSATENETLTAIVENNVGDVSAETTFVTPADPTVFVATPIINSVLGNSMTGYTVKGIATPGNNVELHNAAGEVLGAATTGENGGFTIEIPIGFAEPKELVSAIAKDSDGNQSEPANFKLPADPGDDNGNNGSGNGSNASNNGSSSLKNLSSSQKDLPNNGEIGSNWGVLGAILLGAFAFFNFKRKTKKEDE